VYRKILANMTKISIIVMLLTFILVLGDLLLLVPREFVNNVGTIRVSVVDKDGSVPFQNWITDQKTIDQLSTRPEAISAFETGFGSAKHFSNTLKKDAYYVAFRINDNQVIKFTFTNEDTWRFLRVLIRDLIISFCVALLVTFLSSSVFTKKIIRPINEADPDADREALKTTYPELTPFVERIHEQEEHLRTVIKHRTEFSGNVSHELNTPITEILLASQTIEYGVKKNKLTNEQIQDMAHEISQSSKRLGNMVKDILELSKLDEKNIDLNLVSTDLVEMFKEQIAIATPKAKEKNLKFDLQANCLNKEGKFLHKIDQGLYSVVIRNLIENAVKYSKDDGTITIKLDKDQFSVNNPSLPIAPEEIDHIFERFYRTDKVRNTKTSGYGLGLSFVRQIVIAHGGDISVTSNGEDGTTFIVTL
jgi:two-component system phosphate regulon sensor histidine kinase PhoR